MGGWGAGRTQLQILPLAHINCGTLDKAQPFGAPGNSQRLEEAVNCGSASSEGILDLGVTSTDEIADPDSRVLLLPPKKKKREQHMENVVRVTQSLGKRALSHPDQPDWLQLHRHGLNTIR